MNKRICKKKLTKDLVIVPLSPLIVFPGKPKWKRLNTRVHYKLQHELWSINCVTVSRIPNKNNRVYDKQLLEKVMTDVRIDGYQALKDTLKEHPSDDDLVKQLLNSETGGNHYGTFRA